jgi:parvulin-like peptidyl-prolyl isomerase
MPGAAHPSPDPAARRRTLVLLGLGAVLGLAAAAAALLQGAGSSHGGLPDGAVASVNGTPVRLEEYQRAVAALASDRREPLGAAEKAHVLDRLIEEELLVQRGLELGLAERDRRVRGDLVSAVIQAVVSESESEEPDDAAIADFYAEHQSYFARTGRLFVRQLLVRGPPAREESEAQARATEAVARLRAGEAFEAVEQALGDRPVAPLPADFLPAAKLREYLGPSAMRVAEALAPGEVSEPVRASSGYHVLRLEQREPGDAPPLAEIRDEVRSELRRRSGDRALRDYLDGLRGRADVRTVNTLP